MALATITPSTRRPCKAWSCGLSQNKSGRTLRLSAYIPRQFQHVSQEQLRGHAERKLVTAVQSPVQAPVEQRADPESAVLPELAVLSQPGPNISALSHRLQEEWDHAANLHRGNIRISKFSAKKVWWICNKCPDGHPHRWQATVNSRSNGSRCPMCSGKRLCKHNSLAAQAPQVATFWDESKNGCSADMIVSGSHRMSHWYCSTCKYEWTARPADRVFNNSGCPRCNRGGRGQPRQLHPTFAESGHALLAQWDHERNAAIGLYADKVTLWSGRKVHWICKKCPVGQTHAWQARPCDRIAKRMRGCPFCSGARACQCNSLQEHFPAIAAEWDYAKNDGTPDEYTTMSHVEVWWQNEQKGSWKQRVACRTASVVKQRRRSARGKRERHEAKSANGESQSS